MQHMDSLASVKKRLFDGDDFLPEQLVAKRQKIFDLQPENAEPQQNAWDYPSRHGKALKRDADLSTGLAPQIPKILVDSSMYTDESPSDLKFSRVPTPIAPSIPKPALVRRNSADLCKPMSSNTPVKKPQRPCRPPPESPSPMKIRHLTPNRYNSVPALIANPYSPQKLSAEELSSVRAVKESRYAADFIELKEIGRGGFGSVFECRHVVDGWVYAVKRSIRQLRGHSELRQGLKEVFALASLPAHPNGKHCLF